MINVSNTTIDATFSKLKARLFRREGVDATHRALQPLYWYIGSARASTEFLRLFVNASPQQLTAIANHAAKSGSYDEVLDRVCKTLRYTRAA